MNKLGLIVLTIMNLTAGVCFADGAKPTPSLNVLKEVFLKGSIDGKSMFMVLGLQKGIEVSKEYADNVFADASDLQELGEDYLDIPANIIGTDCKDGLVQAICNTADDIQEHAPRIFSRPFKSLQKIPQAYKVDFDNARSAYYHSQSGITGALKFSGWAVWANIHGAYYLVIEAPARMMGNLLATVGSLPVRLAVATLEIAFETAWIGLKTAFFAGQEIAGLVGVIAIEAYSVLSATTATALTAVYAGGLAVYKAGRFVLFEMPRKLFFPVSVALATAIEFNDREQRDLAAKAEKALAQQTAFKITRTEAQIGEYNSKMVVFARDADGDEYKMGVLKVRIQNKKLALKFELTRKAVKGQDKAKLKALAAQMLADIAAS